MHDDEDGKVYTCTPPGRFTADSIRAAACLDFRSILQRLLATCEASGLRCEAALMISHSMLVTIPYLCDSTNHHISQLRVVPTKQIRGVTCYSGDIASGTGSVTW